MSDPSRQSSPEPDEVSPPWGSLPAEKYLLQNWDSESSENPDDQRTKLVREFLREGPQAQNGEPSALATASQITTILKPWRTVEQREIATNPSEPPSVWLRTCYAEGSDEKHEELVSCSMEWAVEDEKRILSDASLYDYGEHWERVLDVMPELVADRISDEESRAYYFRRIREAQDNLEAAQTILHDSSTQVPETKPPHIGRTINMFRKMRLPPAEVEQKVIASMREILQSRCVATYIYVEDEEALRSGRVLLLFLDAYGNIVRQGRVYPEDSEKFLSEGLQTNVAYFERDVRGDDAENWVAWNVGGRYSNTWVSEGNGFNNDPLTPQRLAEYPGHLPKAFGISDADYAAGLNWMYKRNFTFGLASPANDNDGAAWVPSGAGPAESWTYNGNRAFPPGITINSLTAIACAVNTFGQDELFRQSFNGLCYNGGNIPQPRGFTPAPSFSRCNVEFEAITNTRKRSIGEFNGWRIKGIKMYDEPVVELPADYVPPGPLFPVTDRSPIGPLAVSNDAKAVA